MQHLDAVYFDTPEHDSRRTPSHAAPPHRRAGRRLAPQAAAGRRRQDRGARYRSATATVDGARRTRDVVLAIVRDRTVGAGRAHRDHHAHVDVLYGPSGDALAEFCDDQVTASAGSDAERAGPGGSGSSSSSRARTSDAGTDLLDRLANRLFDAGAEPAGHGSKLARVLSSSRAATRQAEPATVDRPGAPRRRRAGRGTAGVGSRGARRRLGLGPPDAGGDPQDPQSAACVGGVVRHLRRRLDARRTAAAGRDPRSGTRCRGARRDGTSVRSTSCPTSWCGARCGSASSTGRSDATRPGCEAFARPRCAPSVTSGCSTRSTRWSPPSRRPRRVGRGRRAASTSTSAYKKVRKAAKTAERPPQTRRPAEQRRGTARDSQARQATSLHRRRTGRGQGRRAGQAIQTLLGDHQDSVVSRTHLSQEADGRARRG